LRKKFERPETPLQPSALHKRFNELRILSLVTQVSPEVFPYLIRSTALPAQRPCLNELIDDVLVTFVLGLYFTLSEASILIDLVQLGQVLRLFSLQLFHRFVQILSVFYLQTLDSIEDFFIKDISAHVDLLLKLLNRYVHQLLCINLRSCGQP